MPNLVPSRFLAVKRYAVRKNLCKALFANPFAKMNKIAWVAWKLMREKYAAAEVLKSVDATKFFHIYFIDIQWDKLFIRRDYIYINMVQNYKHLWFFNTLKYSYLDFLKGTRLATPLAHGTKLQTPFRVKVQNWKHLYHSRYKITNTFTIQGTKLETPFRRKVQNYKHLYHSRYKIGNTFARSRCKIRNTFTPLHG
jgi:hypothetical protein